MIICEVNKAHMHTVKVDLIEKHKEVESQLNLLKQEYARLYNETMPELIPEYIQNNPDVDNMTLQWGSDYLTRTRRDVKFLIDLLDNSSNATAINSFKTPMPQLQNSSKFSDFTLAFNRRTHTRRNIHSKFISPSHLNFHLTNRDNKTNIYTNYAAPHTTISPHTQSQDFNNSLLTDIHRSLDSLNTTILSHERTKRFLPAVALASGVLGTFFGLFNANEINNLRSDLNDMRSNQNLLVQMANTQTHHIRELESNLWHLTEIFSLFIKNNPALLYAKFNDQLMILNDHLNNLKDTIQMLQLQKLSTSLLTSYQLTSLYSEIENVAKSNDLSPLTTKPQDLFQLDTSYIRIKNEVLIIVHVPCSNPANLLTIYKYVPFPIPVLPRQNSSDTNIHTIQDVFDINAPKLKYPTEGIHFIPETDLIAIGKTQNGKHRYILITSSDLQACTKRSQAYICERHQVTRSDLLGSCIGSLYLQSPTGVFENCKIDRVKLRETVYQISNTQHIIFTPTPINSQITCINGTYFPIKIKNTKQIYIPEGCSTELINHTITSDFSIRTDSRSIHFEWDFDPLSFPNSAQLLIDSKSIDNKLKLINKHLLAVQLDDIDTHEFDQLMINHYSSGSWISILFLVLLSIAGLIGVGVAAVFGRNYLLARGRIHDEDHEMNSGRYDREKPVSDEDLTRLTRSDHLESEQPPNLLFKSGK